MRMYKWLLALLAFGYVTIGCMVNDTVANDAYAADWPEMQRKIEQEGKVVDEKNEHGATALMWAAAHGRKDMVGYLLDKGADPNAADNYGNTALIRAAEGGHVDVMTYLITEKNVQAGPAALENSIHSHNPEAVRFLLTHVGPTDDHLKLAKELVGNVEGEVKKSAQEIVKILKKKMGKWF